MPIAAPSANRSGQVSPTTAAHVAADLGDTRRYDSRRRRRGGGAGIDDRRLCRRRADAAARRGRPARAHRSGARAALRRADAADGAPQAPGMLASHYAPRARLRLDAAAGAGRSLLAFGPTSRQCRRRLPNLSASGDLREAAANLFAASAPRSMRPEPTPIAVVPIPEEGLGEAINDRLRRAAAPRSRTEDDAMHATRSKRRRPEPIARFHRHRRRDIRHHRPAAIGRLSHRMAPPISAADAADPAGPARTEEVSRIMALANETGTASCRRAAIPGWSAARSRSAARVVLSLDRLNRIRAVDPRGNTHDRRSRRHAGGRAGGGRGGRAAVPA